MINVHEISISFAGEYLFENISYRLQAGDRVGLVGKNGAGKSTMLKILAQEQQIDTGQIAMDKEISIGFLKQDIDFTAGRTVLQEAYEAFTQIKSIERRLEEINLELAQRTDYESQLYIDLITALSDLTQQYEIIGGYNYQGETEKILYGLGFKNEDFDKLTDTFSGGWRMRIELAKLLLQNHQVLLLDEPTNHLDIESIIWLEHFMKSYSGAVVIVSHDRMFLDHVTNRTIEISLGRIYDYSTPYSKYLVQRQEIRTQQLAAQKNQNKQIEHTEKLIQKFRAKATKASMAQSLLKKLNKIDRILVDEEDHAVMHIKFPVSVQPGKVVIKAKQAGKSYGEKIILDSIDLEVVRGEKVAFVGQNGQGKSTLAKMLANEIPFTGEITLGHNVQIGYFAQNQSEYLDGEITIHQTMIEAANETNRSRVRDMLGAFLFQGEEVDKKVKVLSGGERNRLALCKLMLQSFNVLVMDEPTNHLDIKSKNVLKEALKNFEGTLILVSHDRDFLQGLTNTVYEFKDKKIKSYLGDIDYFLEERKAEDFRAIEKKETKTKTKENAAPDSKKSYANQKKIKSLKNKLSSVESKIEQLEKKITASDQELANTQENIAEHTDFFKNYQQNKQKLTSLMQSWEQIQEELENLENT